MISPKKILRSFFSNNGMYMMSYSLLECVCEGFSYMYPLTLSLRHAFPPNSQINSAQHMKVWARMRRLETTSYPRPYDVLVEYRETKISLRSSRRSSTVCPCTFHKVQGMLASRVLSRKESEFLKYVLCDIV